MRRRGGEGHPRVKAEGCLRLRSSEIEIVYCVGVGGGDNGGWLIVFSTPPPFLS